MNGDWGPNQPQPLLWLTLSVNRRWFYMLPVQWISWSLIRSKIIFTLAFKAILASVKLPWSCFLIRYFSAEAWSSLLPWSCFRKSDAPAVVQCILSKMLLNGENVDEMKWVLRNRDWNDRGRNLSHGINRSGMTFCHCVSCLKKSGLHCK